VVPPSIKGAKSVSAASIYAAREYGLTTTDRACKIRNAGLMDREGVAMDQNAAHQVVRD
jgi:hypothetical protein